jgi:hypothetical protein
VAKNVAIVWQLCGNLSKGTPESGKNVAIVDGKLRKKWQRKPRFKALLRRYEETVGRNF